MIDYIKKLKKLLGFERKESTGGVMAKELERMINEGKEHVTRDDLDYTIKAITGSISGPIGHLEIHVGEIEKELDDKVTEHIKKMESELNVFAQMKEYYSEKSAELLKKIGEDYKKTQENYKAEMEKKDMEFRGIADKLEGKISGFDEKAGESVKGYVKTLVKNIDKERERNREMLEGNVEIFKKKVNGLETMARQHMAESMKENDEMRRKNMDLMALANEAIDYSKALMINSDRNVKDAISKLERAQLVILYQDNRIRIIEGLVKLISENIPRYAKKLLEMSYVEKHGKDFLPYIEMAAEMLLNEAKKQEGSH